MGSAPRIKEVAEDLVNHFEDRISTIDGKAMIVCMSRDICVEMFNAITDIRPGWKGTLIKEEKDKRGYYEQEDGTIRIVMTGSASDRENLQQHIYSKLQKKRLEKLISREEKRGNFCEDVTHKHFECARRCSSCCGEKSKVTLRVGLINEIFWEKI